MYYCWLYCPHIFTDKVKSGNSSGMCILSGMDCCNFDFILQDDMDKKIRELTNELEFASRKCEVYRANLLSVLKDIEDHKLQLSIKVQNIKISMKDSL